MQIEEQIKSLLKIKAKIDLYRKVMENISAELKSEDPAHKELEKDHPGLMKEFCTEVLGFCEERVQVLGNPSTQPANPVASASQESLEKVKKMENPSSTQKAAENGKAIIDDLNAPEPIDPLRFTLKYRGMVGKKVMFSTPNGEVTGVVKAAVTPFLRVETDTGHYISIKPSEVHEI